MINIFGGLNKWNAFTTDFILGIAELQFVVLQFIIIMHSSTSEPNVAYAQ